MVGKIRTTILVMSRVSQPSNDLRSPENFGGSLTERSVLTPVSSEGSMR
jgi:hypothetical protein